MSESHVDNVVDEEEVATIASNLERANELLTGGDMALPVELSIALSRYARHLIGQTEESGDSDADLLSVIISVSLAAYLFGTSQADEPDEQLRGGETINMSLTPSAISEVIIGLYEKGFTVNIGVAEE